MATIKVNADDEHLENMAGLSSKFESNFRLLLDGNLDLETHNSALFALGAVSAELAELVGFMRADVARLIAA